jgi:hypothetical protein
VCVSVCVSARPALPAWICSAINLPRRTRGRSSSASGSQSPRCVLAAQYESLAVLGKTNISVQNTWRWWHCLVLCWSGRPPPPGLRLYAESDFPIGASACRRRKWCVYTRAIGACKSLPPLGLLAGDPGLGCARLGFGRFPETTSVRALTNRRWHSQASMPCFHPLYKLTKNNCLSHHFWGPHLQTNAIWRSGIYPPALPPRSHRPNMLLS